LVQSGLPKPLNLLERFFLIIGFVKKGYKKIYIHYSYWSLFLAKFISLFTSIKIYYWNCEKYDSRPDDKLLPLALTWCDVLVTGSEGIAKAYRKVFNLENKSIKVVPNWVQEISSKTRKLDPNAVNILFVHHLSPRKGSRELPVIVKETVERVPSAHFHIIGDGPDEEWLKLQVTGYRLQDYVTFYGSLPLRQVAGFYKATGYLIMPSRSEGFPRVILEAMIYRLPFVSTDVGCVKEIVGDEQKRYLVEPGNKEKFAQLLVHLIKSDSKKLIEQNYERASDFTKKIASEKLVRVYTGKS
jgi:glycosyltransferase involved in cell wall biosynthesis